MVSCCRLVLKKAPSFNPADTILHLILIETPIFQLEWSRKDQNNDVRLNDI